MNVYKFRLLLSKKGWGKSYNLLRTLKGSNIFKKSFIEVYIPHKNCDKTIIALGQMHTVLKGDISRWSAKKIAKTQARLYFYYKYFYENLSIRFLGEEGVTEQHTAGYFRYNLNALKECIPETEMNLIRQGQTDFKLIKKILVNLSLKWQKMIKILPPEKVAGYANNVSGSMLYSLENKDIYFYAIEGEKEYRFVLNKITGLQTEVETLKRSSVYNNAKRKGFKNLDKEEYNTVILINNKIKTFNNILSSSLRDEATLSALSHKIKDINPIIYTIGMAHKKNLFKLAKKKLNNISLIMIIPPELWFWQHIISLTKKIVFLLLILICLALLYYI